MSTPEQPATPPLTRKQMRELRDTGSNPVVTTEAAPEAEAASGAEAASAPAPAPEPAPAVIAPAPVAPLARAAEPIVVAEPPMPDAAVDLGVSPLTRRQARQQERIRTASVPVITPELAAAHTVADPVPAPAPVAPPVPAPAPVATASQERPDADLRDLFGLPLTAEVATVAAAADPWAPSGDEPDTLDAPVGDQSVDASTADEERESAATEDAASDRAVVSPLLGASLLAGQAADVELPPSFDQLLTRSSSGTGGTPHALIVSQASAASPIVAPVNATGEVLVTGTLNLPEGLGSNGHAPGVTDGREVDASLVDGELPAHSSPTPIAASAAISTVKNTGEIIKPPAPEKGSKLMMTLAITAGVLALALVGVLILAFVTGVF